MPVPRNPEALMEPDASPERALLGSLLGGKYRVLRVLGEGGVGVVYEAENSWTGRRVALKVLRPEFAAKREVVRRFKREAQAATQINHPHIVDVLDMGEDRAHGTLYIVQELLTGTDLRCWLDRRAVLPADEAVEILTPVMGALIAAHRRGIVHRDIKPENIFLVRGPNGRLVPKLIDFGISKIIDATSPGPKTTVTGTAVGTPNYMSPEQARGDGTLDGRSDVWSVGAVFYEMLTGRPPFEAPTHTLLLLRIVTERPTPVDAVNPAVPPHIAAIVHRALEPDPAQRYPTMRAMLADLVESPGFDASAQTQSIPPAVWDELQLTAVARDVARAETLALPAPVLPGLRVPAFAAALLGAVAMFAAALAVPGYTQPSASTVIHAGMPRSSAAGDTNDDRPPAVVRHATATATATAMDTVPRAADTDNPSALPSGPGPRVSASEGIPTAPGLSMTPHRVAVRHARPGRVHPSGVSPAGTNPPAVAGSRAESQSAPVRPARTGAVLRPLSAYPEE